MRILLLLLLAGCSYQPNCHQYCIGSDDASFSFSTDIPEQNDITVVNN